MNIIPCEICLSGRINMTTQANSTNCKIEFECRNYVEDEAATQRAHKTVINKIIEQLADNNKLLKNTINNGVLHLTFSIDALIYDDLADYFTTKTGPAVNEQFLSTLDPKLGISDLSIKLTPHQKGNASLVCISFGNAVCHSQSKPLVKLYSTPDKSGKSSLTRCFYPEQTKLVLDRFDLQKAKAREAGVALNDKVITIRKMLDDNGAPKLHLPRGWQGYWGNFRQELVIKYPYQRSREKGELRLSAKIDIARLKETDAVQAPDETQAKDKPEQVVNDGPYFPNQIPFGEANKREQSKLAEQADSVLKLKYVVVRGSYLKQWDLADIRSQGKTYLANNALKKLGIDAFKDIDSSSFSIELAANGPVTVGRVSPGLERLDTFKAERLSGEVVSLAQCGFSRQHLVAELRGQQVYLSPMPETDTCYLLRHQSATPVRSTTQMKPGDNLLIGCLIFSFELPTILEEK